MPDDVVIALGTADCVDPILEIDSTNRRFAVVGHKRCHNGSAVRNSRPDARWQLVYGIAFLGARP